MKSRSHSHLKVSLVLPCSQSSKCMLCTMRRSRRTLREPTWTWEEHANYTQKTSLWRRSTAVLPCRFIDKCGMCSKLSATCSIPVSPLLSGAWWKSTFIQNKQPLLVITVFTLWWRRNCRVICHYIVMESQTPKDSHERNIAAEDRCISILSAIRFFPENNWLL